ncbi:hypothetical protein DM860_000355 [Cuscuta australis]|uniref:glutathione transferase n=1 Tax=Cuscuta australis TaxID=267555 RepID=A0A328CZB0_9ASTE|nr:hypothetical protein DM860_000355 [Cuscuta australis]
MATADTVKLLGTWWSPFVLRVRIALNLKSVEYEFIEEPMFPKSELLLESNPVYRKVPVLIHNHRPIPESAVIAQYIDDVWSSSSSSPPPPPPSSIFPSDPYHRATALFWSRYIDHEIFPIFHGLCFATHERDKKEEMKKLAEKISPLEDVLCLIKRKGNNKFFGGERIGWLDIALGSLVGWFTACNGGVGFCFEGSPSLSRWAEDFAAEDAVRGVLPPAEELVEFAKGLSEILKGARKSN